MRLDFYFSLFVYLLGFGPSYGSANEQKSRMFDADILTLINRTLDEYYQNSSEIPSYIFKAISETDFNCNNTINCVAGIKSTLAELSEKINLDMNGNKKKVEDIKAYIAIEVACILNSYCGYMTDQVFTVAKEKITNIMFYQRKNGNQFPFLLCYHINPFIADQTKRNNLVIKLFLKRTN